MDTEGSSVIRVFHEPDFGPIGGSHAVGKLRRSLTGHNKHAIGHELSAGSLREEIFAGLGVQRHTVTG